MTHTRAKQDSQRQRKITLRKMDRVVGTVAAHARRYRKLLDEQWEQTEWTRPQAEQVLRRMDQVLEQLPQARKQARQRILSGKLVDNQDKILSLYERDVRRDRAQESRSRGGVWQYAVIRARIRKA